MEQEESLSHLDLALGETIDNLKTQGCILRYVQRWIPKGERSGLLMRIAAYSAVRMKS
jgi:hypothetical protein